MASARTERRVFTARQEQALALLGGEATRVLLEGGARSGKTLVIVEWFVAACLFFAGIRFLFARHRRQHAKDSLWHETLLGDVLSTYDSRLYEPNIADLFVRFYNGSEIWVGGTDDRERLEKLLGRGVAGGYLNEASQISYDAYSMMRTRLAQKVEGWVPKLVCDCNPPSPTHWLHQIFVDHVEPRDGRSLDPAQHVSLKMNPAHNRENLPDGYEEGLADLPDAERRRFLLGEWVKPTGAIYAEFGSRHIVSDVPECETYLVGVDLITYAAVLLGVQRYVREGEERRRVYVIDEYSGIGMTAAEVNSAIVGRWEDRHYTAYIDHNLGQAGTREFAHSDLADKGPGSLEAGINLLRQLIADDELLVHRRCTNTIFEFDNYRRDDKGRIVKENDHFLDAVRMPVYSYIGVGTVSAAWL